MTLSKQEQIVQVIDSAFEAALKDQHSGFAWELFWEYGVISKLQDYNFKLMSFNQIARCTAFLVLACGLLSNTAQANTPSPE